MKREKKQNARKSKFLAPSNKSSYGNKINWDEIGKDPKKMVFLVMLIVFLPLSMYLLISGQHLYFFLVAAVFYGLIQVVKRK